MDARTESPFGRFHTSVWQAPLVPAAFAVTLGAVAGRYIPTFVDFGPIILLAACFTWFCEVRKTGSRLALPSLLVACVAFGAVYHRFRTDSVAGDDISRFVNFDVKLGVVRGVVVEDPIVESETPPNPLRSYSKSAVARMILQVSHWKEVEWQPVSGRVQLTVTGLQTPVKSGDQVEVVGTLYAPESGSNPGGCDHANRYHELGIGALMKSEVLAHTSIVVGQEIRAWTNWIASIREWSRRTIDAALPSDSAPVALALLLGDGRAMSAASWEKYRQTGVMHVLVVSGQHLIILAAFFWFILKCMMVPRRHAALIIVAILLVYTAVTGGRPPAVRAFLMVSMFCGGIFLKRISIPINTLAAGWLLVFLLDPANIFDLGCQLSFLSVLVLFWTGAVERRRPRDPLEELIDEFRPCWERTGRRLVFRVAQAYVITAVVALAVTPVIASQYHLVPLAGLIIGPPVVFFSSIALISGFVLLLAAAIHIPLVGALAWVTHRSLVATEAMVDFGTRLSFSHWYVPDISATWLWVFYLGLVLFLLIEQWQVRWRFFAGLGLAWICVGLAVHSYAAPADLRCTFLAVGHGGCTVMETPDGRVLLYDAGAMDGPEVTRRHIAPFLWSRGIRRVDELFISHADLDHFNGLPSLLERFAIGQITCTPTFADKESPGVAAALDAIRKHEIPVRIVNAGDVIDAGSVIMEVLHPTPKGPVGRENFRSMVLRVEHAGHSMLLTGDLEGPGLQEVVQRGIPLATILMAPHHGSRAGDADEHRNRELLVASVSPKLIIGSQGRPRASTLKADPYETPGAQYLGTWPHGAITLNFRSTGVEVETFRTQERFVVTDLAQSAKNRQRLPNRTNVLSVE